MKPIISFSKFIKLISKRYPPKIYIGLCIKLSARIKSRKPLIKTFSKKVVMNSAIL